MSLPELDMYYITSVGALHSFEHILNREPSTLQLNLEEAIKNKTGIIKDFGPLIATATNRPLEDIRTHGIEETKTASSSDNELELDLFNDDLMCIICNGMDVGARNRLLECCDCHSLYHQECHQPPVISCDSEGTWTCQNCMDASQQRKMNGSSPSPLQSDPSSIVKSMVKNSPPPSLHRSSGGSSGLKSLSKSPSAASFSKSSKSSKSSSSSSGSSKGSSTPNINIISADKRLQIMKKKAAKMHEKRKQPR